MSCTVKNAEILIKESKKQLLRNQKKSIKPDYYECIQLSARESFIDASYITLLVYIINIVHSGNIPHWCTSQ
jgi:hypothetical protein